MDAIDTKRLHWSKGNLEAVESCPACGSKSRYQQPLVCFDHVTKILDDQWALHRCADCESLYLDPRPDAESLPMAYENYYTHAADDERPATSGVVGLLWSAIHGYLNRRFGLKRKPAAAWGYWLLQLLPPLRLKLDYYGRHLFADRYPARGQLLDVGCGNGAFLERAKEMGWSTVGIDMDPKAVEFCRKNGLNVFEGTLTQSPDDWKSSFEIVTLRHCIEHVQNPAEYLRIAYEMLKTGGEIWIAWPNTKSLGLVFFEEAWAELHAPHHLCIPSPDQLHSMLELQGFREITFRRRGMHARVSFMKSMENARERGAKIKFRFLFSRTLCAFIDLYSSLTRRSGIEVVVIAVK